VLAGGFIAAVGRTDVAVVFATAGALAVGLIALRRRRRSRWPGQGLRITRPVRSLPSTVRATMRAATPAVRLGVPAALATLRLGTRRLLGELLWVWLALRKTGATARIGPRPSVRQPKSERPVPQVRDALRLNAQGIELRRGGEPERAVECHREALEILEALGDRRAAALTQNNIALALERAGAEDEAVAHFEEAIEILRDLHDREREGQVIANLGVTLLRHGRRDEAIEVLEESLEKLGPDSAARPHVERQLLRAG
jgi:tetratricopeptide (TPR) repeat protein